jgi:DNA modification methylase
MATLHEVHFRDASRLRSLSDNSIELVVTSPPYPMIEMWDQTFCSGDAAIEKALKRQNGNLAFDLMHRLLESVWREIRRVLIPGGITCINIGDATRTIDDEFRLYPNHAATISIFRNLGFSLLPVILWRKPTNAPNKFMGSGMLPPGAYVTLEHEHILIFRNGDRRLFKEDAAKRQRHESAYFWEERNVWFSDVWFDLIGTQQKMNRKTQRSRSGAFPLELPYRLINMFSVRGDTVLDPFSGTGTTMQAAMCAGRNSVSYEIDDTFQPVIQEKITSVPDLSHDLIEKRLDAHQAFVQDRTLTKSHLKYRNRHYGFPVMTRQEENLKFDRVSQLKWLSDERFEVTYAGIKNAIDRSGEANSEHTEHPDLPFASVSPKARQLKII